MLASVIVVCVLLSLQTETGTGAFALKQLPTAVLRNVTFVHNTAAQGTGALSAKVVGNLTITSAQLHHNKVGHKPSSMRTLTCLC